MKIIERLARRFTTSVSDQAKTEVKKTALDMMPTVVGIVSMIVGIVIFKGVVSEPSSMENVRPTVSTTHITNNNYFFKELSEESIRKIIEED